MSATDNTRRTGDYTSDGSLDAFILPVALAGGLETLKNDAVVAGLVDNYSDVAKAQGASRVGASVRIPMVGGLTAGNKTANSQSAIQANTSTKYDIPITTFKTVDVLVEDYGMLFVNPTYAQDLVREAMNAIVTAVETAVIANYASAGSQLGTPEAGASANLVRAIAKKASELKWGSAVKNVVWGNEGTFSLLADTIFTASLSSAGDVSGIRQGKIGQLYGLQNYTSNLMPAVTGSPDAEHALAFRSGGIGIAFCDMSLQNLPEAYASGVSMRAMDIKDDNGKPVYSARVIFGYNQLYKGMLLTVDTLFGTAVLDSNRVIDILV